MVAQLRLLSHRVLEILLCEFALKQCRNSCLCRRRRLRQSHLWGVRQQLQLQGAAEAGAGTPDGLRPPRSPQVNVLG